MGRRPRLDVVTPLLIAVVWALAALAVAILLRCSW